MQDPEPDEDDCNFDPATIVCPECREEVSEDAERCPCCGYYFTREDARADRPWWVIAVIVLMTLLAAITLLLFRQNV